MLRLVLLSVAFGVVALVVWQWRPAPEAEEAVPGSLPASDGDRRVVSRTEGLDFTHTVDGVPRYRLRAAENVEYDDDIKELQGGIELVLFPAPEVEDREPVRIYGDRMITRGQQFDDPSVVELEGDVRIRLPNGGQVRGVRLVYRDRGGIVRSDDPVELRTAGLLIHGATMRYDRRQDIVRLRDDVRLVADPGAEVDQPAGLRGTADALESDFGASQIVLSGTPSLDMAAASIRGDTLTMLLAEGGGRLTGLLAEGSARAIWHGDAREGGGGDDDAGALVSPSMCERPREAPLGAAVPELTAAGIELEFDDSGKPTALTAPLELELDHSGEATASPAALSEGRRPCLRVGNDLVEADGLTLRGSGNGRTIEAEGGVEWRPGDELADIRQLRAESLVLHLGEDGGSLDATGIVRASLRDTDDGGGRIAGRQLGMEWKDGEVSRAEWPSGWVYQTGSRRLEGSAARYDTDSGAWVVEGDPDVRAVDDDLELTASTLSVSDEGEMIAEGEVVAGLATGGLTMLAALFPDVARVHVASPTLRSTAEGDLAFREGVRVWSGEQMLVARQIVITRQPARLEAEGDLFLSLRRRTAGTAPAQEPSTEETAEGTPVATPRESGDVELAGRTLLVEDSPPVLRVAGDAELREGERVLSGDRLMVALDEGGEWQAVELVGEVALEDPAGTASGARMTYDPSSGEMVLEASQGLPAVFTDTGGVRTQSPEALHLTWSADQVRIAAREQGRTRTVLVPRQK